VFFVLRYACRRDTARVCHARRIRCGRCRSGGAPVVGTGRHAMVGRPGSARTAGSSRPVPARLGARSRLSRGAMTSPGLRSVTALFSARAVPTRRGARSKLFARVDRAMLRNRKFARLFARGRRIRTIGPCVKETAVERGLALNHRCLARRPALNDLIQLIGLASRFDNTERPSVRAVPILRTRFPPAKSQQTFQPRNGKHWLGAGVEGGTVLGDGARRCRGLGNRCLKQSSQGNLPTCFWQ